MPIRSVSNSALTIDLILSHSSLSVDYDDARRSSKSTLLALYFYMERSTRRRDFIHLPSAT